MDLKIDINAEEVNQHVTAAIINSALGEKLKAQIEETLKKTLFPGYGDPKIVEQVVKEEILQCLRRMISSDEYREKIKATVEKWFTEKMTDQIIGELLGDIWDKLLK